MANYLSSLAATVGAPAVGRFLGAVTPGSTGNTAAGAAQPVTRATGPAGGAGGAVATASAPRYGAGPRTSDTGSVQSTSQRPDTWDGGFTSPLGGWERGTPATVPGRGGASPVPGSGGLGAALELRSPAGSSRCVCVCDGRVVVVYAQRHLTCLAHRWHQLNLKTRKQRAWSCRLSL